MKRAREGALLYAAHCEGKIMKRKKDSENKTSNKRLIDLYIIVLTIGVEKILDVLFQKELPRGIFFLVICYIIGKLLCFISRQIVFGIRDYKKYRASLLELSAKFIKNEQRENEENNIYVSFLRKRNRRVYLGVKYFVLAMTSISILCALNPQNTKAMRKGLEVFLEKSTEEEKDKEYSVNEEGAIEKREKKENNQEKEDCESESYGNKSSEMVSERQKKPADYEFVLLDVEKRPLVDAKVYEQVYFNKKEDISQLIQEFIKETLETPKDSIDWNGFPMDIICTPSSCEQMQKDFEQKISEYKNEIYLEDWQLVAPTSSQLDEIMDARNYLNAITINEKQGNYLLWWRLANDNQRYARQYEIQTNNKDAVFYYYTMSIYCCMESLKYDISEIQYEMIFEYMITRYEDIAREESIVDEKDKVAAENIAEYLKDNYKDSFRQPAITTAD